MKMMIKPKRGLFMNDLITTNTGSILNQAITRSMFDRFIAFIDGSPKTIETYTRALKQLHNFFHINNINQPTREDLLTFKDWLKDTGHKPTTIQNYITATRLFFSWASQAGLYPNIAEHLKGAKLDREHKKDYLTSKQVKAILAGIDRTNEQGARDYAILTLMITGGLRTIEVIRASIEDLSILGDNAILYIQGKGREEKTEYIKLTSRVESAIREYLKYRPVNNPNDPLFASTSNNNKGKRLTTRSISGIVKARLREAGFNSDKLTAHSLRHTAVTLSLLAGKDITEVQQFARHSNIATTMIYNHALEKAKNSCSEAITKAIF